MPTHRGGREQLGAGGFTDPHIGKLGAGGFRDPPSDCARPSFRRNPGRRRIRGARRILRLKPCGRQGKAPLRDRGSGEVALRTVIGQGSPGRSLASHWTARAGNRSLAAQLRRRPSSPCRSSSESKMGCSARQNKTSGGFSNRVGIGMIMIMITIMIMIMTMLMIMTMVSSSSPSSSTTAKILS